MQKRIEAPLIGAKGRRRTSRSTSLRRHTAFQWVRLGYIRQAANLMAWLAAMMAFWLMAKHGG
jgi:hypothetical protein